MPMDALKDVRAVVFDFDGTLADTQIDFAEMRRRIVEHIKQWGLWEEGLDEGRYVLEIIDHAASRLAGDPEQRERYITEAAGILEDVEMLTCPQAEPFPRTAQALGQLARQGYKLGIITRNCRAGVQAVLDRHRLPHDVLLTRDDVESVKPDKAHLLEALEALRAAPDQTIMVGDHPTDIECGQAAGALTCGVLTAKTSRREFHQAGADLVVDDVAALSAILCTDGRPGTAPSSECL